MSVERIIFDPARLQDFELVAEVGDTFSEEGLTRVKLDGNGRLVVEQQREKARGGQFQGEIDRQNTESVLRQASQFDWEQRFPSRRGLPDEAVVQWSLRDHQGRTLTVKVWLRDAEKDAAMAPVLAVLRKSVERASDGKLYL